MEKNEGSESRSNVTILMDMTYYMLECGHMWAHQLPLLDGCPYCLDYNEALELHAVESCRRVSEAQFHLRH